VDDTVLSMLRRSGKRITPQRIAILETIRRGAGHLDASEIYRLSKLEAPNLSLSTVYRTIALLKDAGLVEELRLGEDHHHYELRADDGHHHLVCQSCGRVVEFDCPFSEALLCNLGAEHGFEITDARLSLTGYCLDCRRG
jgi:Fur family peroxide stress response transcriptional regulator